MVQMAGEEGKLKEECERGLLGGTRNLNQFRCTRNSWRSVFFYIRTDQVRLNPTLIIMAMRVPSLLFNAVKGPRTSLPHCLRMLLLIAASPRAFTGLFELYRSFHLCSPILLLYFSSRACCRYSTR